MKEKHRRFLDVALAWVICYLCSGTPAPDINESHYLPKARHFWDPSFGQGDLFLESADAHTAFFLVLGWLTYVFSLPTAAWVGRCIIWLGIAIGWCHLATAFSRRFGSGSLSLLPFLMLLDLGHLSGEWVVGGFEAKGVAYGFLFWGMGQAARGQWKQAWISMGLGSAFHVVVGAWVTLSLMLTFLVITRNINPFSKSWREQWVPLGIGGFLSLAGLIPALLLNRSVPKEDSLAAAQIYVYQRLPHHLSPLRFASERWWSFCVLCCLAAITAGFALWMKNQLRQESNDKDPQARKWHSVPMIWTLSVVAGLIGAMGIAIDWQGEENPQWSAALLRFYWFRWNDVAWPMAISLTILACADGRTLRNWKQILPGILLIVPAAFWLADRTLLQWNQTIPEADGRALLLASETPDEEWKSYEDWIAVCRWIRENSPEREVWLTPRYQQTFKWYAHRAEIVNWKDVPQDASKLVEWSHRLKLVYHNAPGGGIIPNTPDELFKIAKRFHVRYLLLDRRVYPTLPSWKVLYAQQGGNRSTFVVLEVPEEFEASASLPSVSGDSSRP